MIGLVKLQVSQSVITLGCSMEYMTTKASRCVMSRGTTHKVSQGANTPGYSTCGMAQENRGVAYATEEAITNIHMIGMVTFQVSQSVITLGCSMEYVTVWPTVANHQATAHGAVELGTYMVAERRGGSLKLSQSVSTSGFSFGWV